MDDDELHFTGSELAGQETGSFVGIGALQLLIGGDGGELNLIAAGLLP